MNSRFRMLCRTTNPLSTTSLRQLHRKRSQCIFVRKRNGNLRDCMYVKCLLIFVMCVTWCVGWTLLCSASLPAGLWFWWHRVFKVWAEAQRLGELSFREQEDVWDSNRFPRREDKSSPGREMHGRKPRPARVLLNGPVRAEGGGIKTQGAFLLFKLPAQIDASVCFQDTEP